MLVSIGEITEDCMAKIIELRKKPKWDPELVRTVKHWFIDKRNYIVPTHHGLLLAKLSKHEIAEIIAIAKEEIREALLRG